MNPVIDGRERRQPDDEAMQQEYIQGSAPHIGERTSVPGDKGEKGSSSDQLQQIQEQPEETCVPGRFTQLNVSHIAIEPSRSYVHTADRDE